MLQSNAKKPRFFGYSPLTIIPPPPILDLVCPHSSDGENIGHVTTLVNNDDTGSSAFLRPNSLYIHTVFPAPTNVYMITREPQIF